MQPFAVASLSFATTCYETGWKRTKLKGVTEDINGPAEYENLAKNPFRPALSLVLLPRIASFCWRHDS
jgi:hypothetical protein